MMTKKQILITSVFLLISVVLLLWPEQKESPSLSYFHNQGIVFGTTYSIQYEATEDHEPQVLAALSEVDSALSLFNPSSILSRINRGEQVTTNADFEAVYETAMEVSEQSQGALDITVAPLVNLWGFGLKHRESVTPAQVDSLLPLVGYQGVYLEHHHLTKNDHRMMLDAGAVAKGYGCDKVADALCALGVQNFLVEIGGEVVAQGVNSKGQPWSIGITKPIDDPTGVQHELQDIVHTGSLCMATSGNYRNFYYEGSERRSHTIDPRTGYPVQHNLLAATVVANTCARADAIATACMVLGAEEAIRMVDSMDEVSCYLIVADGEENGVVTSAKWTLTEKK